MTQQNPFVHRMKMTPLQKTQIFLMSFTLAPIRFFFAFGLLLVTWVIAAVFTIGASSDFTIPVRPFRQSLYNFLRKMGRIILFLLGVSIEMRGKRASSKEAPILIGCPHSSYLDIMLWFVTGDLPAAMTKEENLKLPIFGTLFKAVQPVFVQRTDVKSRAVALNRLKERVSSGGKWPQVIMFPEGTCTNKTSLITFKRGAFVVGVPVQPLVAKWQCPLDYVTWTEISDSSLKLIWIMICQIRTRVIVEYLPVYHPNEEEKSQPNLYAENVRKSLAEHLGVPCSEFTYEDRQLMRYAKKISFPQEHAVVEFHRARMEFGVDLPRVKSHLDDFAAMMTSPQQHDVCLQQLAQFLDLPDDLACVRALFSDHYDVSKLGRIDFREYVRGISSLAKLVDDFACERMIRAMNDSESRHREMDVILNRVEKNLGSRPDHIDSNFLEFVQKRPEFVKLFQLCMEER